MSNKLSLKNIPAKDRAFVSRDIKSIAKKLKKRRENLGLSQEKLAELLDVSVGMVKGIEQKIRSPSLPNLIRLARILKINITLEVK